jgi:hypothetical protein
MGIGISSGEIFINLFVVDAGWMTQINLAKVTLKALSCLLSFFTYLRREAIFSSSKSS